MTHLKPQNMVVLVKPASPKGKRPGRVLVVRKELAADLLNDNREWVDYGQPAEVRAVMTDAEIYTEINKMILDLVEFKGVPIRQARDAFADSVEGYQAHMQKVPHGDYKSRLPCASTT